ncbi:MAG: hypothetical protein ALECFALPRED_010449 [Alectoria fallacina]|uniref:EKC/KEOPS complex subunit CGI121 n=1 Tax=Alectoria fallacina TaxID=1903189 RepID=A0A8H3J972_9LECA|nr:MAG: hypothetical protein ALECFALPRED_010449 [Alectoria fallacina]
MPFVQSLTLAHLPPDLAVHVALYTDVQNAPFLRDQLLRGNPDHEYALIDASVVPVFRAANDYLNGRLKSRNVHSEIVFSLGANNNIAQSLRTFGIAATTTNLVAIKLSTSPDITASTVSEHLAASVKGTAVEFSDAALAQTPDVGRIRKLYKLSGVVRGGAADDHKFGKRRRKDGSESEDGSSGGGGSDGDGDDGKGGGGGDTGGGGGGAEEGERRRELEGAILGLMALRGAV